ncbi:TetR family transcriptional regulator [Streptomyces sp. NPDC058417]|uniref:TetR family transcriptional regulator n=1 Tax=unclassified Streptomyces TaxID=2593676 RepID=UPI003649708D
MAQPKQERSTRTRAELLRAAAEVFAERGLAGTSLPEIAARAGVTKSLIHYHFAKKSNIAAEVLDLGFVTMDESDASDDMPHLQKVIDAAMSLAVLTPEVTVIRAANRLGTEQDEEFFGRQQKHYFPAVKEVLVAAKSAGELLPGVECEAQAKLWVNSYTGTELLTRNHPETLPREIAEMNLALARGIAAPETMGRLDFSIERGQHLAEKSPLLAASRGPVE